MSALRTWLARRHVAAFRKLVSRAGDTLVIDGTPTIVEWFGGRIEIGDRFTFASRPVASHMYSAGLLRIGDDVTIGHGAAIAATQSVTIGDRTQIGPFLLLMDTDFHGERAKRGARITTDTAVGAGSGYAPIAIGCDVRIGPQVTILKGSTIGDGATIAPGSVVNGRIPPNVYAAGVPARVGSATGGHESLGDASGRPDAARIAAAVFGLSTPPASHEGPQDIPEWDSLGALKLLLALEDALGRPVDVDLLANATSIADVQTAVDRA